MEDFCINLDNGVADYEVEDDFSKLHFRDRFSIFSDEFSGFTNRAKKKFRFLGRSQSSRGGVAYQKIVNEEETINGEGRKKSPKFRFYLKKKRWAFRLPRARLAPIVEMIGRARDSYKKLCKKMHENPSVVINSQWGIPNFYQPYYL